MKTRKINFKLLLFVLYNFAYVLYMIGIIPRIVNLALLLVFIISCLYKYIIERNKILFTEKDLFKTEFFSALKIVGFFLLVSIIIQIYHHDYQRYLFNEILYNLIPPVIAFFWINTTEKKDCFPYFVVFFLRTIFYFILKNKNNFSLDNIMMISWNDSKSSVFEIVLAHDFLFLEIIFLYFKKEKFAIISLIFCLLSFKRLSFILAIIILILYYVLRKKENILNNSVNKLLLIITLLFFCIVPFFIQWLISDNGISFFYSKGIDLNKFTTGRTNIVRYVINNIKYFNGYGSSDYFMEHSFGVYALLGSMHCDTLKLYYEVTEIGVIIYFFEMLKIARKHYLIFFMLFYLFLEVTVSHFLDQLSVWNMFFMFAAYVYSYGLSTENEKMQNNSTKKGIGI